MTTTTHRTSRTAHLLALMKKGDDAFNARDFAAVDGQSACRCGSSAPGWPARTHVRIRRPADSGLPPSSSASRLSGPPAAVPVCLATSGDPVKLRVRRLRQPAG